ncbi:MAG: restriction endonuclease, partial [Myxococcales bacterium]
VRVAKRSKEGPLYLARQRRGVSDLRVAVKLVRGAREIGRPDVQELRKDLAHYSAQMGLVLAPGEAGRDARSEASAAGQAPVALYCGEALPEEMIALRVGVTVQTVEVPDMDEAFFAGLSKGHREERPRREREERTELAPPPPPAEEPQPAELMAPEGEPAPEPEPEQAATEQPAEQAPASEEAPAMEVPAAAPESPEEPREGARRPRRGGREDRPRATNAAEQAWGQPAGTMRFAPPPGPTVAVAPSEEPPGPPESPETPAPPPETKPEP